MRRLTVILLFVSALLSQACSRESELITAIKNNDHGKVKQMLEAAGDVDAPFGKEQRTALMLSSFHGSPELVELLLDEGALVSKADRYGRTPLHFAAKAGNCENIRTLVRGGATIDHRYDEPYYTPLMEAAQVGSPTSTKCLIALGADINHRDGSGYTALMHAVWSRNVETVKVLIDAGAETAPRNTQGYTAADIALGLELDEIRRIVNRESPR